MSASSSANLIFSGLMGWSEDGKSDVLDTKNVVDPGSCESFFKFLHLCVRC